jgi:hypothetical protein
MKDMQFFGLFVRLPDDSVFSDAASSAHLVGQPMGESGDLEQRDTIPFGGIDLHGLSSGRQMRKSTSISGPQRSVVMGCCPRL